VELLAEANRVDGVLSVNSVLLAEGSGAAVSEIKMSGLQLPRVAGISVTSGDPSDLDQLRGQGTPTSTTTGGTVAEFVSVPIIPEECL
jgi:hypothetical protein